ncbi:hypothetical protein J6590_026581 [Homalodisca vitripennis]|nr:hypothetical protein J6590_026581 [Homalodisca vitripennis]
MSGEGEKPIETPEEELEANYKPPPEKTIEEILEADKEDESLRKYKETLLGEAGERKIIVDESDERKVIVKRLALCVNDRPDVELDLTTDLNELKKQVFIIKEGVSYRIRIDFIVQREIVHGLKYVQKTYRLGVPALHCLVRRVLLKDTKELQKISMLSELGNQEKNIIGEDSREGLVVKRSHLVAHSDT